MTNGSLAVSSAPGQGSVFTLRLPAADPPDLLLLDMQLPDTDGLSVLRALRRAPQSAGVVIVIVSATA